MRSMDFTLINSAESAYALGQRIARWLSAATPAQWRGLWTDEGLCICVLCRRPVDAIAFIGMSLPSDAKPRVHAHVDGLRGLIASNPTPGEMWYGTCFDCPLPHTTAEKAALADEAYWRTFEGQIWN